MPEFVFDPAVIPGLARSSDMSTVLQNSAQSIADRASENAPVSEEGSRDSPPGALKGSYKADVIVAGPGFAGRAFSDDPVSAFVEFGTSNMDAQAPLRRALDAGGNQ